jgi:hypothetical protein
MENIPFSLLFAAVITAKVATIKFVNGISAASLDGLLGMTRG